MRRRGVVMVAVLAVLGVVGALPNRELGRDETARQLMREVDADAVSCVKAVQPRIGDEERDPRSGVPLNLNSAGWWDYECNVTIDGRTEPTAVEVDGDSIIARTQG